MTDEVYADCGWIDGYCCDSVVTSFNSIVTTYSINVDNGDYYYGIFYIYF